MSRQTKAIDIKSDPQLFIDDYIVDSNEGVHRQFHRPTRYDRNPVVQADMPWEQDGNGVYLYGGTVIYDEEERIFKMWYRASSEKRLGSPKQYQKLRKQTEKSGSYKALYATSKDGLDWEKIPLGLTNYEGSKKNNILPPAEGTMEQIRRPNLIKDYLDDDPNRRYKIAYMDNIDGKWGLAKGYSADGIRWRMNIGEPTFFEKPVAPNGILFGWDPQMQKFVHFHRLTKFVRADVDGRMVVQRIATVRSTSNDFERWGDTTEIIRRAPTDPYNWSPAHGVDLAAILYTNNLYVGFSDTCTTHSVEDVPLSDWNTVYQGNFAEYRTELLTSRDGNQWTRVAPHWEFMRPGLWGTWDRSLVGLSKPIVLENEILFYYTGSDLLMDLLSPSHPKYDLANQIIDNKYPGYAIGLAKMRRDGFVSMDGYEPTGELTTKPVIFDGNRLVVNVRSPEKAFDSELSTSRPYGQILVELLDPEGKPIPGYSRGESDTFTGDSVRHTASWKGNQNVNNLKGHPIRIRFHLKNSALYSFQFHGDITPTHQHNLLSPGAKGRPKIQ